MKTLKTTLCVMVIIFAANLFFVKTTYAQVAVGSDKISTYVVRQGDTIGEIAEKFGINIKTLLLANDIKIASKIKIGQKLLIPPVSSQGLGKKVSNNLIKTTKGIGKKVASFFVKPVKAATKTQGIHGKNGVDLAAKEDTPILAAANGKVTVSQTGWNGGYGNYVVITHNNGLQTLYAHNNENLVSVGDKVIQGQIIAHMGSTGKSTGSHVHFEVRGGKNPF